VEVARLAGRLPGLVARDTRGRICGWTFYLLHNGVLEIGALQSTSRAVTAALLGGALASSEARGRSSVVLFAYSDAPALAAQLRARAFAVERYLYLSAALSRLPAAPRAAGCEPRGYDHARHAMGVVDLLAAAYSPFERARPFVRGGQPRHWAEYLAQLMTTNGCGQFLAGASFVASSAASAAVAGATLATRLAADTVHLAQIAVRPEAQGHGMARCLMGATLEAARAHGLTRATLLVGEGNTRARQLYERLGFLAAASFVSAVCDQPRRSSIVALETGGAMTLR
jgi:ribosomal protein S18 acetylase RimI-like enzyme